MPPDMEEMRNPKDPHLDSASASCLPGWRPKAGVMTLRMSVACRPRTDPSGVPPQSRRSKVAGGYP